MYMSVCGSVFKKVDLAIHNNIDEPGEHHAE
jgi:hypothetical protein